jgi:hypothetical protein
MVAEAQGCIGVGEIWEKGMDYQLLCVAASCSRCSMLGL